MTWSDGYVTEVEYTSGYYRELSPVFLDFALLLKGFARPAARPGRYLELGFGQGLSLNVHAATCEGEYWGTDFLPQQVGKARELAARSGADLRLLNDSFTELAARDDLPEFDIIGLHGIWSWISPDARDSIVEVVRRRLAVGGTVYISYNTQPGWSPAMPMRHLMTLHAQGRRAEPLGQRIGNSLLFLEKLSEAGGLFFKASPSVIERVKSLKGKDARYVAHEYFNENWHCSYFAEVADAMATARLDFAASAYILDHVDGAQLTTEGMSLLAAEPDIRMRETIRDYLVNQQFRRDIFTKGARRLAPAEQRARLADTPFAMLEPLDAFTYEIGGARGKVQLKKEIYEPILAVFAEAPTVTLRELCDAPGLSQLGSNQAIEAVTVLVGAGILSPAQDSTRAEVSRVRSRALNDALLEAALTSDDWQVMASPVLGSGVPMARVFRLLMKALAGRTLDDEELMRAAVPLLRPADPLRGGPAATEPEPALRESLAKDIARFRAREPIYRRLGIM